jgi:hypothetical protein
MFNYKRVKRAEDKIQEYKNYIERLNTALRKIAYRVSAPLMGCEPLLRIEFYLENEEAADADKAERAKIEEIVLDLLARQKKK